MSANRQHTEKDERISWGQFLMKCESEPICRVQGKRSGATRERGRLVRFNRAVRVHVHTASMSDEGPSVHVNRVRWDWRKKRWIDLDQEFDVLWKNLDWVTWKATGDPNYTWKKVV